MISENYAIPHKYPFLQLFLLLFLLTGILGAFFNPPSRYSFGGDRARFATAESLVERGTFAIDDSPGLITVDKVYIDGHFYGCQPPVMSILITAFYFPLHKLGLNFARNERILIWILTLIFSGGSAALTAVLLGKIHHLNRSNKTSSIKFALLFFFTTLFLSYCVSLNNHIFAGFLIILSYYLTVYKPSQPAALFFAGLSVSTAFVTDPPAGMAFAAALFIYYLFVHKNLRCALLYIIGAIPPLLIHSLANMKISGSVFPVNVNPEYFQYPGTIFNETNLSGVVSNDSLKEIITYGFNCLFGPRGLFIYTPLLIFALIGCVFALKHKHSRPKVLLIILPIIFILAFYIWRTQNYGGDSYGIRFFLAFMPVLFLGIILMQDTLRKKIVRLLFKIAVVWSFIFAAVGIVLPAPDADLGLNSFVANLFFIQTKTFPQASSIGWKVVYNINGRNPQVADQLGYWMTINGQLEPAKEALQLSMKELDSPASYYWMGAIEFQLDNYTQALDYFRQTLAKGGNYQAMFHIGKLFYHLNQNDSSSYYFRRYLAVGDSINEVMPKKLFAVGQQFYGMFEKDMVYIHIAGNYIKQAELDSAGWALNKVSPKCPENKDALIIQARYYACLSDTQSAILYMKKLFRMKPILYRGFKNDSLLSDIAQKAYQELRNELK